MIRRFVLLLLLGGIATAALSVLFARVDQLVLASEKARTALEVTDELNRELNAATYASNLIAFAILGGLLSIVGAIACSAPSSSRQKAIGAAVGLVLGAFAGALGAALGHWYVDNVQLPVDPMVQWAARWTLILLPMALAAGLATASAGNLRRDLGNALAGGVIGAIIASVAFAVLHGMLTEIENFSVVMPRFVNNRVLIFASTIFGVGLGLLWQVKTTPAVAEAPETVTGQTPSGA